MIFSPDDFEQVLAPSEAVVAAKQANRLLDENAAVLYGRAFEDGSYDAFTRQLKEGDTHKVLAIGLAAIGLLTRRGAGIAKETLTDRELLRAAQARLRIKDQLDN